MTATLTMVPLAKIRPSEDNPRTEFADSWRLEKKSHQRVIPYIRCPRS
jgi:hypothetical protein